MFRSLERAENTARLIEAGFRFALTRSGDPAGEWRSVIISAAVQIPYEKKYDGYDSSRVTDYLLRDIDNPSSVLSVIKNARDNARLVRTALTTEVWSAVNDTWLQLQSALKDPVSETDLPEVLATIRQYSALVRGALHGTMLRNDIYDFCRLGTFIERLDSTARILDFKYFTLLPPGSEVGSEIDDVQWETLLRSVSAHRSFGWAFDEGISPARVAGFLILDRRMPRSLAFSASTIVENLNYLADEYGEKKPSHDMAEAINTRLKDRDINKIFGEGLHEFLGTILQDAADLGRQVEEDYRFVG